MKASKIVGIIIIIISLAVAYVGINKIDDNTKEVNLLGLKIKASDESGKQEGYIYLGIAVALFAGGLYTVGKSKS
ncbi:MAG: hypothetical protein IPG60_08960 [Bacteroidetes bacterium]|nr:hypothetical protein [Bacteroidota bacterium]MBP7398055.1 hypothetical protein [Chitinophagales bacterium]MBK7109344.1 hypothetical protein [Bacteroidota bacterium]MBK8487912.1 hypothetical protein [Bacteroidota bacterium]MBK8682333.1 hypothetical protein [Bacteroidota bacterium]